MNTAKTLGTTVLIATLSYAQVGCEADRLFEVRNTDAFAEAQFTQEVALGQQERLELAGVNGHVEVVGVPGRSSVSIEAIRRVESESASDAKTNLDRLRVVVTERSSYVRIRTDQPRNNGGRNFIVNYTITVPSDLEVEVDNVNGEITIETLENACDVQNVNGRVRLVDLAGETKTAVVNGEIEAALTLAQSGVADLQTVNGSIELEIPQNTSATLEASVTNGTIAVSGLSLLDVIQTPRSLNGMIGTGAGTIRLSSVNGSIRITGS